MGSRLLPRTARTTRARTTAPRMEKMIRRFFDFFFPFAIRKFHLERFVQLLRLIAGAIAIEESLFDSLFSDYILEVPTRNDVVVGGIDLICLRIDEACIGGEQIQKRSRSEIVSL